MRKTVGIILALAAAAVLAACNSSSNNGNNNGLGTNCGPPPSVNQVLVVYPKNGANKVPANVAGIFIATKGPLASGSLYSTFLLLSNGNQGNTAPFVQVQESKIPTPHATPSYANPTYYVSPFYSGQYVGPNQTVNVLWNNGGTYCNPNVIISKFHTK